MKIDHDKEKEFQDLDTAYEQNLNPDIPWNRRLGRAAKTFIYTASLVIVFSVFGSIATYVIGLIPISEGMGKSLALIGMLVAAGYGSYRFVRRFIE